MRYFKSLVAFVALLFATSCAVDNIDGPSVMPNDSDVVTVMGRVTRFTDCDVDTRGVKNGEEGKITSMAMAIYRLNQEGTRIEACEYFEYKPNQNELLFTIERGTNYAANTPYAMYIFCNVDMKSFNDTKPSLDALLAETYNLKNLNIPENGFPMMGSLGDTFSTRFDKDNQKFILSPMVGDKLTAPTVAEPKADGSGWEEAKTQTLLTVPMKAMYAKVNFTIEVRPDQTIEGNYSPQFTLDGCTINNAAGSVDFDNTTNSDTNVLAAQSCNITGNKIASGANKVTFSFYLPERYLTPTINCEEFKYPFGGLNAEGEIIPVEGYSNLRKEDQKYAQRFKSKLVEGKAATNVVISGQFRDHQNHYWDVDYTIYLGEDNYGNFDIRRNYEYNNFVTIRGIQSSDDMSDNQNGIAIDHRVDIERTQPAIISLRREVLLDSHFEVRPLRIRKSDVANIPNDITHVKVEVVNPETTNWMRLERSFGDGNIATANNRKNSNGESFYITDEKSPSYGKRRYFTYDLINGTTASNYPLTNSTEVIVPLNEADECVWIYVDECTESGDGVRAGIIRVTYGNLNGSKFTSTTNTDFPVVNYTINQRKLFTVTNGGRTYYIEYEEEYLHNFDADDNYGQTEFDGMEWGLPGQQLSFEDDAIKIQGTLWDGLIDYLVKSGMNPKYDFYNNTSEAPTANIAHPYNGYNFTTKILAIVNNEYYKYTFEDGGWFGQDKEYYKKPGLNTDSNDDYNRLTLAQESRSAVEYCLNKNKRDANGYLVSSTEQAGMDTSRIYWYLPAIDEIEHIVTSEYVDPDGKTQKTYARFIEFQSQFYWSSQPAYYVYDWYYYGISDSNGNFYIDALNYARSTSVSYVNNQYIPVGSSMNAAETYHSWNLWSGMAHSSGATNKTIVYGDGYDLRTEKNRVRCVRKM